MIGREHQRKHAHEPEDYDQPVQVVENSEPSLCGVVVPDELGIICVKVLVEEVGHHDGGFEVDEARDPVEEVVEGVAYGLGDGCDLDVAAKLFVPDCPRAEGEVAEADQLDADDPPVALLTA